MQLGIEPVVLKPKGVIFHIEIILQSHSVIESTVFNPCIGITNSHLVRKCVASYTFRRKISQFELLAPMENKKTKNNK